MLSKNDLIKMFEYIGEAAMDDCKVVLCGGSNMVISTGSREATQDVDYLYADPVVVALFNRYARKYGLPLNVLNDDVKVTSSYSERLLLYQALYKQYDRLSVYALQPIALLCMKLKSFREDSSDYSDCKVLVEICKSSGISLEDVKDTLTTIYPTNDILSVEASMFLNDAFGASRYELDAESITSYIDMLESGVITEDSLPSEFREQVLRAYNKMKTDKIVKSAGGFLRAASGDKRY